MVPHIFIIDIVFQYTNTCHSGICSFKGAVRIIKNEMNITKTFPHYFCVRIEIKTR